MVLTPAERRGALVALALLLLGAARDLWRLRGAPPPAPPPQAAAAMPWPDTVVADSTTLAVVAPRDSAARPNPRLDLNRAGAAELDALPGVGPVLAARIVEQRRRFGPFRRVDDLRAVRGVGPRLLARLRPLVSVTPAAP
jgi:competence ComEA-like helix-hairpin-helix protein